MFLNDKILHFSNLLEYIRNIETSRAYFQIAAQVVILKVTQPFHGVLQLNITDSHYNKISCFEKIKVNTEDTKVKCTNITTIYRYN